MKKSFIILMSALLFLACAEEKKEELEFSNYTVERTYKNCSPEEGDCAFINLNYPVVVTTDNTAAETMNMEINRHVINSVDYQEEVEIGSTEELADRFIADYDQSITDFPEYDTPWEASVFGEVLLQNQEIISLQLNSEIFTGGAHGYSNVSYLNFNPETGERYSHKELFKPGFRDHAEEQFRKSQDIPADEPINSTGLFFEKDEFELPENIGFTPDKVILHYNAYEIASYSDGDFRLEFPKEEVQQYLKISLEPSESEPGGLGI